MKRGFKAISLLILVVITLTAVLSGCSGDKVNNNGSSETSNVTASDGELTEGGEVTVGISQDLDSSLDPHRMVAAGTAGTREVLFNVFEGLVKPDSDGNLIPAVASDYAVDGAVYTFTLREGVMFHNGQVVTAEDVIYSLERVADSSSEDTYVPAFSALKSVEKVDENTVKVELEEADLEFLANFTVAIIPKDYEEQSSSPVGTGPFKFVSYSPQESLVVQKSEDYWGESAYLDKVTFKIYSSVETMIMALNSGAVDIAAHLGTDEVNQLSSDEFNVLEGTMNLVQALYLNHDVEPFNNLQVRQAMCYAVDIEEIMLVLADGMGTEVGSSMIPAFSKYINKSVVGMYEHDTDKAKELLKEAGYEDGFNMTITVPANYEPHVLAAQVIVQQLAEVGITAAINSVEWTTWYENTYVGRNYEATIVGLDASTMTASAMLSRFVTGAGNNFTNYSNQVYDDLYQQAKSAANESDQIELFKLMQKVLAEDAANVYLQDLCDLVAIRSTLEGYKFYPLYVIDMSTVKYTQA